MTALRFSGVETTGIGQRAMAGGAFDTPLVLIGCRGVEPVVDVGSSAVEKSSSKGARP